MRNVEWIRTFFETYGGPPKIVGPKGRYNASFVVFHNEKKIVSVMGKDWEYTELIYSHIPALKGYDMCYSDSGVMYNVKSWEDFVIKQI